MGSFTKKIILGIAVLCLSACSSAGKGNGVSCPMTGLVEQADQAVFWQGTADIPPESDILSTAHIGTYRGACRLSKKGGVDMVMEIDLGARRGLAGPKLEKQSLSYFVAILDKNETVITRRAETVEIEFDKKGFAGSTETLDLHIPSADVASAPSYKILLGFVLTEKQLAFNRRGIQ